MPHVPAPFCASYDVAAVLRGIARDAALEGEPQAERLHRDRYHAAEMIYTAEIGPELLADLIIDNSDFACPVILGGLRSRAGARAGRGERR